MTETIKEIVVNTFDSNPTLATIIIAMLPIFELRGAIPFGMSTQLWGDMALSPISSFLVSLFASSLVVPIIALLVSPILKWLKTTKMFCKLAEWFETKIKKHTTKIENTSTIPNENLTPSAPQKNNINNTKKMWGVFLFVGIPLPLTGVYTGTCMAVMLGLNFYETLLCVVGGNILAGIIMLITSTIFKSNTLVVLYIFIAVLIAILLYNLIKKLILKFKTKSSI